MSKSPHQPDELTQKRVAYYSTLVNAWVQTRLEVDKTLIIISSAGIGFLFTIQSSLDVISVVERILFIGALISFLFVIVLCIHVLNENAKYIESIIHDKKEKSQESEFLNIYDMIAQFFFALALIFVIIMGISLATNK